MLTRYIKAEPGGTRLLVGIELSEAAEDSGHRPQSIDSQLMCAWCLTQASHQLAPEAL